MFSWFLDLCAYLTFAGFGYLLWHFWGQAARRAGMSRLTLLGLAFLLGKLFG